MKQALDALHCIESPLKVREIVKVGKAMGIMRKAIEAAEAEKQEPDEPDELTIAYMSGFFDGKKKREWVSLTDDDIYSADCVKQKYIGSGEYVIDSDSVEAFARAIEAKLREKNGC